MILGLSVKQCPAIREEARKGGKKDSKVEGDEKRTNKIVRYEIRQRRFSSMEVLRTPLHTPGYLCF